MPKRFTDTDKWKKPFIRGLQAPYKLLWFYILDDCDHAGIWHVDQEIAEIRIGEKLDLAKAIELFGDKVKVFDKGYKWFIPDFIKFQYGELREDNRAHRAVFGSLNKYDLSVAHKPLTEGLEAPMDKEQEKEKEGGVGENKVPPSIELVKKYCLERKNSVDVDKWMNFYQSKGWMIGKTKMKDWKAAIRTWERSGASQQVESSKTNEKL